MKATKTGPINFSPVFLLCNISVHLSVVKYKSSHNKKIHVLICTFVVYLPYLTYRNI